VGGLVRKIVDFFKSPHIQIALTVGICIIVMAYFSKRILPEPIGYLPLAIPPFIATIFEVVLKKYENSWISKAWIWIILIFLSTFLVILFSA
jgi:predicted histidine transporter YuiF (NhaC family)